MTALLAILLAFTASINRAEENPSREAFITEFQVLANDEKYLASINPFPITSSGYEPYNNFINRLFSSESPRV